MHERYLEITFRRGKPVAAYLFLPRLENDKSWRVAQEDHGLLVDLAQDGRPIGIEILAPTKITLSNINEILTKYSLPLLDSDEVAPLQASV
jgi:hypothetical protein